MTDDATIPTKIVSLVKERKPWPHFLVQTDGEGAPKNFILDKEHYIVGRAETADIPMISKRASRQHAVLARQGEDYLIRDNESQNGIFLNGLKVHSAILRDGDILQIADCIYTYHEG